MTMVPKGKRAVRDIRTAPSATRYAGGRADSKGYDPATGEEHGAKYRSKASRESDAEFDVFATVNVTGYREDRFYTRSVNADGHGERLNLRVPQGIDTQMHAAVAEVPEYKTLHDLVRDAVIHRLEYLQKRYQLGDSAQRMLVLERYRADSERRSQEIDSLSAAVAGVEEKCKKAWDAEDYGLLAEEMDKGYETLEWLRDPYKAKLGKVLDGWKSKARSELERLEREREV